MTATMLNQVTKTANKKRVRFSQDQEVTAVHRIERVEESQLEELFYQVEEVEQFRQDFYIFRAQEKRAALNLDRVNSLVQMARGEMLSRQKQAEGKLTSAPIAKIPMVVSRPSQRRNPLRSTQKGRAQMA